jgi:hypothetical protein
MILLLDKKGKYKGKNSLEKMTNVMLCCHQKSTQGLINCFRRKMPDKIPFQKSNINARVILFSPCEKGKKIHKMILTNNHIGMYNILLMTVNRYDL